MVHQFGAPEVLVMSEVPDPSVVPGDALIEVGAADVLWVETMIRKDGVATTST